MNLEKRTVRNKVWWIAGAILLPLLLFLALGAQDQVVSYSVFKVPAVSAYYFIYYAEKWFGVFHLFLTAAAILVAIVIAVRISDRSLYEGALLRIFFGTASVWFCYLAVVVRIGDMESVNSVRVFLQILTTLWWIAVVIDGTGWICGHVLKKETVEKKDDWKWLFSVLLVVLFITWLMLAWSGKYVYPQGDDFEYGANSHLAWVHGKGVLGAFGGACKTVADAFGSWQGTFSSIFLMALQPGIWGEQYYHLTPALLSGLLSIAVLIFVSIFPYIVWCRKKGGRDFGMPAGNFSTAACTGQSICFLLVERRNSLYRSIQLFAFIHGISDTCDCRKRKKSAV